MTENNGTPEQPPEPGYWEQQSVAQPPAASPTPYGQAPGQPPYGQPQYGQPQYGQPQYGQPHPPPPPYLQPGYPPAPYPQTYAAPDHPQATTALVLGLVGTVGGLLCLLPILVSPFAWAIGVKARRAVRQSNGQFGGEGLATAGMVLGIIGTVVLTLIVIGIVVFVILVINDPTAFDDTSTV